MVAGLPGTGLGGLLYLLLVALMPFRELWMLITGRSSWLRWKAVARMCAMGAAIACCLGGEWWVLAKGFHKVEQHTAASSYLHQSSAIAAKAAVPAMAYAPFIILTGLVLSLHAVRLIAHQYPRMPAAPQVRPSGRLTRLASARSVRTT